MDVDLSALGLNAYEASVYLALVRRRGLSSMELAQRAKVPRQRVYDVLASLEQKGLCTHRHTSPRTFFATDPATALPSLSAERAAELERQRERSAAVARELAVQLGPLFLAGLGAGAGDTKPYVEALADPVRIAARANELAAAARSHVSALVARPLILSSAQNRRFLHLPLERGVRYRALYEESALGDVELRGWMDELGAKGQKIRVVKRLPVKMHAFDDEVALLSMQDPGAGAPSFTALQIRHRGAVALLKLAFERLWDEGVAYRARRR